MVYRNSAAANCRGAVQKQRCTAVNIVIRRTEDVWRDAVMCLQIYGVLRNFCAPEASFDSH